MTWEVTSQQSKLRSEWWWHVTCLHLDYDTCAMFGFITIFWLFICLGRWSSEMCWELSGADDDDWFLKESYINLSSPSNTVLEFNYQPAMCTVKMGPNFFFCSSKNVWASFPNSSAFPIKGIQPLISGGSSSLLWKRRRICFICRISRTTCDLFSLYCFSQVWILGKKSDIYKYWHSALMLFHSFIHV